LFYLEAELTRTAKAAVWIVPIALLVGFAFFGGRKLRQVAASPIIENARITSLPEAKIGRILGIGANQGEGVSPVQTFKDVYDHIKSEYVDKVDNDTKLSQGALRAMLASLDDPKTRYLQPDELKALEEQLNGKFTGIGATLSIVKLKKGNIDYRRLAIVAPAPGGPAAAAGARAGDIITHVDGKWIIAYDPRLELDQLQAKEMSDADYRKTLKDLTKRITGGVSLPKALEMLAATDGKKVELTVERSGASEAIKIPLTTSTVSLQPVEHKNISDKAAYIRITQFGTTAAAPLTEALKSSGSRALIIDLRDNPGAPVGADRTLPEAARALLAALTRGGKVGNVMVKGNQLNAITVNGTAPANRKIAVLVNGGTANVAELVASALKERVGATIIGTKTFGDATLQRLIALKAGGAMTVTAGKYLTANGADFGGKGLSPDISVPTPGPSSNDSAVQRAVSALAGA
jgi:carboxyl-terminal processing protease